MKLTIETVVIVLVTLVLALWFSSKFGWQFGAMYLAGLVWALFDEKLLGRSEG